MLWTNFITTAEMVTNVYFPYVLQLESNGSAYAALIVIRSDALH